MRDPIETAAVFSTSDFARVVGCSLSSAAHRMRRLASNGGVQKLTRGVWVRTDHPYFTPYGCVPHLLGAEQGYVSFLSALHRHGLISQIPSRIQVATTGHGRRVQTPVGTFEFFQVHPRMAVGGVGWSDTPLPYRIAEPEKALLDTLYLATRRARRFASLPEMDREALKLRPATFRRLIREQIAAPPIRKAVLARAELLGFLNFEPS